MPESVKPVPIDPDSGELARLVAAYEVARWRAAYAAEGADFAAEEAWRREAEAALARALAGRARPYALGEHQYSCSRAGELVRNAAPSWGYHKHINKS